MSLSKVLGATARRDGYMEGGGWLVSWCVGHLVELAPADAYDPRYSKWAYDDLPIVPDPWQFQVLPDMRSPNRQRPEPWEYAQRGSQRDKSGQRNTVSNSNLPRFKWDSIGFPIDILQNIRH